MTQKVTATNNYSITQGQKAVRFRMVRKRNGIAGVLALGMRIQPCTSNAWSSDVEVWLALAPADSNVKHVDLSTTINHKDCARISVFLPFSMNSDQNMLDALFLVGMNTLLKKVVRRYRRDLYKASWRPCPAFGSSLAWLRQGRNDSNDFREFKKVKTNHLRKLFGSTSSLEAIPKKCFFWCHAAKIMWQPCLAFLATTLAWTWWALLLGNRTKNFCEFELTF